MVCVRMFSVAAARHGEKLIKHSHHMNIYAMTSGRARDSGGFDMSRVG